MHAFSPAFFFFFHRTFHVLLQVVLGSASKRVGKIRPFKNKIDYFCTAFFNQNHYNWWLRALITPLQRAPLDFARHPWLFYLLIYLFNSFYFLPWFLGHRVEVHSCFKWSRLFLSGRLFFLQGLRSKHAPLSEGDKNSRDRVFPEFILSLFFPLSPCGERDWTKSHSSRPLPSPCGAKGQKVIFSGSLYRQNPKVTPSLPDSPQVQLRAISNCFEEGAAQPGPYASPTAPQQHRDVSQGWAWDGHLREPTYLGLRGLALFELQQGWAEVADTAEKWA